MRPAHRWLLFIQVEDASPTSQSFTLNSTSTRSASAGTKSCTHWLVYDDVVADTAELVTWRVRPGRRRRWLALTVQQLVLVRQGTVRHSLACRWQTGASIAAGANHCSTCAWVIPVQRLHRSI